MGNCGSMLGGLGSSRSRSMRDGPSLRSLRCRFLCGRFRRFGTGHTLQVMPNFLGNIHGDGTRMCLLFGYAKTRQKVNDGFGLDLKLAGEFIDAYLGCVTHASLRTFLFLLLCRGVILR